MNVPRSDDFYMSSNRTPDSGTVGVALCKPSQNGWFLERPHIQIQTDCCRGLISNSSVSDLMTLRISRTWRALLPAGKRSTRRAAMPPRTVPMHRFHRERGECRRTSEPSRSRPGCWLQRLVGHL